MLTGERVYPIAWHVDYWNYLGWYDRFSSPFITARQEHYSTVLGLSTMGTPSLYVNVNGVTPISVGAVTSSIALRMAETVDVSATIWLASGPDASPLAIGYSVLDGPEGSELMIVLVERGLSSVVTSGENAGRTLTHENVARAWITAEGWTGEAEMTVPEDVVRENSSLIGFVQSWSTLDMSGATAIPLHPE
jgi:hypothetical protein